MIVVLNGKSRGCLGCASGRSPGDVGDVSDDEAVSSLVCRLWLSEVGCERERFARLLKEESDLPVAAP